MSSSCPPIRIAACGALTAFGDESESLTAMLAGRTALAPRPVLGNEGGDLVPLGLSPGHVYEETAPPSWSTLLQALVARIPGSDWGSPRRPVFVTSSNFGVGSLYAFRRDGQLAHLKHGTPCRSVDSLVNQFGWGEHVTTFSHACVSAHLGLLQATRMLSAGLADTALVFSYDFLSSFVVGGFHSLKILNSSFPAPYHDGATGSIGLGDGAAFAVLSRDEGDWTVTAQSLHNEMHHFTANEPDGAGFEACLAPLLSAAAGRRLWMKGHGTGTLDAGRLEATAFATHFPDSPLISWKGALGHTLGSCGLVELAIAIAAMQHGRVPGTVGGRSPSFAPNVMLSDFDAGSYDAALCASNAFGGAHAAFLLAHA